MNDLNEKKSANGQVLPDDAEIVGSIVARSDAIFGVPDKHEIFRLAKLTLTDSLERYHDDYLWLRVVSLDTPPSMLSTFEVAHVPLARFSDIVEHNYVVKLQVVTIQMIVSRIKIIHGSETDESKAIVFEATDLPGPAYQRRIRVIRISVDNEGFATYEIVAETQYPAQLHVTQPPF